MPRKTKEIKRPTGKPRAEIDWKIVDAYLEAGCAGTDIAAILGIYPDTLYRRCEQEHNATFAAYSQQKKQSGDYLIKKAQFDKAIGRTELGDNTLLIWLGKVRLEQRETVIQTASPEQEKNYRQVIDQLAELQQDRQNSSSVKQEEAPDGFQKD